MTLEEARGVWTAFTTYAQTPTYMEGLFVEVSGMLLDILLLTILLPLLIWLYQLRSKLQALRIASLLSLQFIRNCTVLLLKAGGIQSLRELLKYEDEKGRLTEQTSHFVYGNTPDLLKVLKSRMLRSVHILGHRSLDDETIQELKAEAQTLLNQCQQYTTLFASLRLHAHAEKYFTIGVLLLALRDYFENMRSLIGNKTTPTDTFRIHSTTLGATLDFWFCEERKRPDRAHKWRFFFGACAVVFLIPYVLLHRGIIEPAMTFLGRPYRAPFSLNITRVLVEAAYQHVGRPMVFAALALNGHQLRSVLRKASASDESIAALVRLRTLFTPVLWDELLIQAITEELHRVKSNSFTEDAYVAESTVVYMRAAFKPDSIILMRLMSWYRSYDGLFGPGQQLSATT